MLLSPVVRMITLAQVLDVDLATTEIVERVSEYGHLLAQPMQGPGVEQLLQTVHER